MKNKLFLAGLFLVTFCALVTTGCYTPPPSAEIDMSFLNEGTFADVVIPVKDFESLGLVFTQVELQRIGSRKDLYSAESVTFEGRVFTYQELLKEAQKLGADAIINVTIDSITRMETTTDRANVKNTRNLIWYGSALAIRYTNAIIPVVN